jgi:hypothetical protein
MCKWSLTLQKKLKHALVTKRGGVKSPLFLQIYCVDLAWLIENVMFKHCSSEAKKVTHDFARKCSSSKDSYNSVNESSSLIYITIVDN